MNNKTSKINKTYSIILILALVLLTICSVACDNGIFTTKNNNLAYTEVLEAKGSFIYNEQKYDSFSEIIKEIKAKGSVSEQKIKIDGDIVSRELVISPDLNINIDLNGYEIKFIDVIGSAIRVEEGASLSLSGGSLTLNNRKNSNLTVITAENADSLDLSDLVIDSTETQTNLDINKVSQTTLSENVVIKGPVSISGGKDNTHVSVSNKLPDVRMNGGTLTIEGYGGATIRENNGENRYAESPHGTIVDQTGSIDSDSVADALYYIDRTPVKSYFGSLEKAIADLKDDENEIILIDDDNSLTTNTINLNISMILNLRGYILSNYNLNLCEGSSLIIKGTGTSEFSGNITSQGGTSNLTITGSQDQSNGPTMKGSIDVSGTVNADSVTFKDSIEADGNINLNNCSFDGNSVSKPDVKSNNASVSLTGAKGTAGNISANDGDISINNPDTNSSLSVNGINSNNGEVNLKGNAYSPLNINGNVKGGKIKTEDTNLKGNVDATTSFEADGCSIGDNLGSGHVYSPSIDINGSNLKSIDLGGGKENNVIIPADNVKIDNPSTDSTVGNLKADKLNINDTGSNLTVDDTILSGDDDNNSINGGNYGEFTFTGTGVLNITDGNFDDEFNFNGSGVLNVSDGNFNDQFNHSGSGRMNVSGGSFNNTFNHTGSGTRSFSAGSFTVIGSNSNNNFSEIDTISSYVEQNGSITIVYYPSDLVYLSGNYSFGSQLTVGKTAKIIFKDEYDEDSQLTKGVAVNKNQTATLNFSSGINQIEGSLFVKLGGTLNSTKDIGIKQNDGMVAKLQDSSKSSLSVSKTGTNPYVFKAKIDVTLRAVGNEDSVKHDVIWSCDYNTPVTLPEAKTLGDDFDRETQKIDGWSTSSASSRTKTYDDCATNVTFTNDIELYAVWKSKVIPSGLVEVPSKHAIVASCMLFDEDGNDLQSVPNGGTSDRWNDETYFYLNTSDNTVKVRGVYNPPEVGHKEDKEEYTIIAEDTVIKTKMNSPYFMGLEVIKAIGDMNHPSGNLDYYFFDKGPWKAYKYSRQGSTWDSSVTEISSFDDERLTVRITLEGTLPMFPDP